MKIADIIQLPEGRRLEFKEALPAGADLARTIVAFANDAGGELLIGIRNEPREAVGVPEEELMELEEQISNLIYDHCHPIIVPDISFHGFEQARLIRVQIYRGSDFPYFLKTKGKKEGTYIRVGSTNRQADEEIIAELERQKRNISFDSEPVFDKPLSNLNTEPFKAFFKEKTGEELNDTALKKLELLRQFQGSWLPSNACILLSENPVRKELFPYAKIECARFKGTTSDVFIDQKTIDENISVQAEAAYDFVLRHVNKGAVVKGVYTESRWEYPVVAIREVIRNAVVHRDYSLSGKDIKVAVYDDMVEITSPGKLMPSIDFNELEARQSDIRNKIIAPVFKRIGVIDQWGSGLKLIADELKKYLEIEFKWFEKGWQFQVQFIKKDFLFQNSSEPITISVAEEQIEWELSWNHVISDMAPSRYQVGTKSALSGHQVELLLDFIDKPHPIKDMMDLLNWKDQTKFRDKYVNPLIRIGIINMTIPGKPQSSKQQYCLSQKGRVILDALKKRKA